MEKNNKFELIIQQIINQLVNLPYKGDIADIGNEIGIVIGKYSKEELTDFNMGFRHGVSLSDGSH